MESYAHSSSFKPKSKAAGSSASSRSKSQMKPAMNMTNLYKKQMELNTQRKEFQKFRSPPAHLAKEFHEHFNNSTDYVPIIGIVTQRNNSSGYDHYVLESNDNINKWSGLRTVIIPYDIPEAQLMKLLKNINGVHLTGGTLDLIDYHGRQHPYYVTAKRCIEFSKQVKDKQNMDWPVLGICQGLEVVAIVQGNDKLSTLDDICVNALHYHNYAVSIKTFQKTSGLRDEFIITQADREGSVDYICAMDHKKYPIFTIMYHPEYRMRDDDSVADEFAFRISYNLNMEARKNDFKWTLGEELLAKMSVTRVAPIRGRYGGLIYVFNGKDVVLNI